MDKDFIYLNSNDGSGLIGVGDKSHLIFDAKSDLEELDDFVRNHKGEYIFFSLSYDLKNKFEDLESKNEDNIDFPLAILWCPEYVLEQKEDELTFLKGESKEVILGKVLDFLKEEDNAFRIEKPLKARTSKEGYLNNVRQLKNELQYGNIYEVNYCQEFFAEDIVVDNANALYHKVNKLTKAPFSCYWNFKDHIVISGSPERFIRKTGSKLISQPIKGTIKRGKNDAEDKELVQQLKNDPKERAENVMIVDLVRNDLSRIATKGSVSVEELFGIYTFETVHQMISTIACVIEPDLKFSELLRALFPMGSMTGAPKVSAMNLIEKHEDFKRGIYSGSIGYMDPKGDFDMNVIIRSLVYSKKNKYLSCSVGGAITIQSIPESEYEECFTKVNAILTGIRE